MRECYTYQNLPVHMIGGVDHHFRDVLLTNLSYQSCAKSIEPVNNCEILYVSSRIITMSK